VTRDERRALLGTAVIEQIRVRVEETPELGPEDGAAIDELRLIFARPARRVLSARPAAEAA